MPTVEELEKTIQDLVEYGTGLDDTHVIWSDGKPRPTGGPYIELRWSTSAPVSQDWTRYTRNADDTITVTAQGMRRHEVELQCFSSSPTGSNSARAILQRLIDSMRLPSQRTLMRSGGIGVSGFEPVQMIGRFINTTVFEPRAITALSFFTAAERSESGSEIRQVEVTNSVTGQTRIITAEDA